MYAWRLSPQCPPEFRQKSAASQAALIRETDFAFKQAFAFCPYSPEAVFRYVNFILQMAQTEEMSGHPEAALRRFDDAILIAQTCKKLDPFNDQVTGLIKSLQDYKASSTARAQTVSQVDQMETTARTNPGDVRNLIMLGVTSIQMQQTNRGMELFDQALASPNVKAADAGPSPATSRRWATSPSLSTHWKSSPRSRPTSRNRITTSSRRRPTSARLRTRSPTSPSRSTRAPRASRPIPPRATCSRRRGATRN